MPNVLVELVLSARTWQACRSGRTWGSERSFPLEGPFLLGNSVHTIWRNDGKGG